MDEGHDHLGQPFVGRPGDWRCMVGENIVMGNRLILEDVLAGPDMITGVTIGQQALTMKKGQQKQDKEEKDVGQGRDEIAGESSASHHVFTVIMSKHGQVLPYSRQNENRQGQ